MAAERMPAAEVAVTAELVRALLRDQHPDLAELPLGAIANGWDNVIVRLGDDLAVRLPRRLAGVALIEHEQRWLPDLAARLPIPIPAPVRVGRPGRGYPWPWSITPWFDGEVAAESVLADPAREARRLGAFMAALHLPAPDDAPDNPARSGHVGDRDERFLETHAVAADQLDSVRPGGARRALMRWRELIAAPRHAGAPVWVAGDVHSANVIVADGEIVAVIDFGDLCAGDPAVDLAIGWMLFSDSERDEFLDAAGADLPARRRGEAWAWYFAVLYLAHSADDARLAGMGRRLTATLLDRV